MTTIVMLEPSQLAAIVEEATASGVVRGYQLAREDLDQQDEGGIELAQKVTNYSKRQIYRLVSDDAIPYTKPMGRLWFSRKKLRQWIQDGMPPNPTATEKTNVLTV